MLSEPQPDAWLSDVLGVDAYAVTADSAPHARAPGMYTAKVAVEDVGALATLVDLGFRVVDVNVTLDRRGGEGLAGGAAAPAKPDQHEALLGVAETCFRYSRFHLDPLIPRELADRVKREWVRSYVERQRGIELLAATADGRAVGFLAVLEDAGGARVIDLIGVAVDAQRRGIGEALVGEFACRHGAGGRTLRVGTQAANIPSLRLYEKLGFRVVATAYVLHRHVSA